MSTLSSSCWCWDSHFVVHLVHRGLCKSFDRLIGLREVIVGFDLTLFQLELVPCGSSFFGLLLEALGQASDERADTVYEHWNLAIQPSSSSCSHFCSSSSILDFHQARTQQSQDPPSHASFYLSPSQSVRRLLASKQQYFH